MRRWIPVSLLTLLVVSGLLIAQSLSAQDATPVADPAPASSPMASPEVIASPQASSPGITLYAGVLQNPRGFTWDSNGAMYVALAGTGGSVEFSSATSDDATPVPSFAGTTASVVRIVLRDDVVTLGCPQYVASGLPSTRGMNGHDQGPSDVAFLSGQLYVLQDGGDSAMLFPEFPNGVYAVNPNGTLTLVADVRDWIQQNPVEHLAYDQGPEGETFAMVAGESFLWVVESNSGQVLKVTPEGEITRMADLSDGHPVPTGIALAPDGGVYVSFLTPAPYVDGSSKVIKVDQQGNITTVWTGLTMVTALAVSPAGDLYALEMATGNSDQPPYVHPDTGRIVKQTGPDTLAEVVVGLDFPISMGVGPDGALYVSTPAFGADSNIGGIVRVDLSRPQPMTISPNIIELSTCDVATPDPMTETLGGAGSVANTAMIPTPAASAAGNSDSAASSNSGGKSATGAFAIEIKNFAFNPKEMDVPKGTTVTWTNMDSVAHTATADDGEFNSGNLKPGQSFSFQFDKEG
ncbi:MAG: ScyD/ScyE family protein, partial [Thermomicrobiales bacterium]|nr:ScyD/ScyE family protein [Thermomicrobiales bacterium]